QGLAAELEDDPAVDGLWLHAPVTLLRVFLAPPHDSSQKARQSRERVTPPAERRPAPAAHPLIPAAKGITVSKRGEPPRALPGSLLLGRLLCDGLAPLKAGKTPHRDVFAHGRDLLLDQVVHGAIRILDKGLFQQANFLEELLEAALDDLVDHVFGLALVEGGGPVDPALLLQNSRRHI